MSGLSRIAGSGWLVGGACGVAPDGRESHVDDTDVSGKGTVIGQIVDGPRRGLP